MSFAALTVQLERLGITAANYAAVIASAAANALAITANEEDIADVEANRIHTAVLTLADADTGAGILSWQNPLGADAILMSVDIDITTKSTGACTIDAGVAATEISNDAIFNGIDVNASTVKISTKNDTQAATPFMNIGEDEYFTISMASGAAADLAGVAILQYVLAAAS